MLRRSFLKLLAAAIAAPFVGWPVRQAVRATARWTKSNLWIGGHTGSFDDPRCWSNRQVPRAGDSIVVNTGTLTVPHGVALTKVTLVGSGTLRMEADPSCVITPSHWGSLTILDSFTGTIGEQGGRL